MKFVFEIVVILAPVAVATLWLCIKIFTEFKRRPSKSYNDFTKKENFVRNIAIYFSLLICAIFLLFFVVHLIFFPTTKLPIPLTILGYIAYLFFWSFLVVILAMGHAAGAGAAPIQKSIGEFIKLLFNRDKKTKRT